MLLDRFRTAPRHKDPDPLVRLAYVVEVPMDDRETIAAIALEDEDPRVRKAAVGKLLDPARLGRIAATDSSDDVRNAAAAMMRDIALDAFEEAGEVEALESVDAIQDSKLVAQIAKSAGRDIVALRAVSRLSDVKMLGSVARHAVVEAARRAAFERVRERADQAEIIAVALNAEYKDTAIAAVESVTDEKQLEHIAERSRNKSASKRARTILRDAADARLREAAEQAAVHAPSVESPSHRDQMDTRHDMVAVPIDEPQLSVVDIPPNEPEVVENAEPSVESREPAVDTAADLAARGRMVELVEAAERAVDGPEARDVRRDLRVIQGEWRDIAARFAPEAELIGRLDAVEHRIAAREAEARESDDRRRREALKRVQQLLKRVEVLLAETASSGAGKPGLHALERALRDVRALTGALPALPTRADADAAMTGLKAAHAALMPRVQELREANEWQQWANVTLQEQLCARMEALAAVEDPERVATEVKTLQQEWRQAANVPLAKADALWRRFKAAHDVVWPRCEAHFRAQAELRTEHLARKLALCEQAEALASSSNWIQAADDIKRLQAEWKTIGPVVRSQEKAVWDRFHAACNRFFTRRHDDLVQRKAVWAANLARKVALCEQAEQLSTSTEWDASASELKRLQAEWRTVGPVRKNKSEAIWQRFRAASDAFFTRYTHRHDSARTERVAAREALCAQLEALTNDEVVDPPADLAAAVQSVRRDWQNELSRAIDPPTARTLDERFTAAVSRLLERWPSAFAGGDLDVNANRAQMESLVERVEDLARKLSAPSAQMEASELSSTTKLAAMLKEALATNTIRGKVDPRAEEDSRLRAAVDDVRRAQASWARVGLVPADVRRPLADRFDRAVRSILQRAGSTTPPVRTNAPSRGVQGQKGGRGR